MNDHRIKDIDFSGGWCLCTCGTLIESASETDMPIDWAAHRKAAGAPPVAIGDQITGEGWRSQPKSWSMKRRKEGL